MTAHRDGSDRLAAALSRLTTVATESKIPDLVRRLTEAGIPVIVLKGPVTRARVYRADEARPVADIDLLVPPRAHRRAGRVLASAGFTMVWRSGHSDTWRRPDVDVDLHLALPYVTRNPGRAFDVLTDRTTSLPVDGHPVPVLDEQAHVVHLALHAAQNGLDPAHRSTEEWRRGRASLTRSGRADAEGLASRLGAQETYRAAEQALEQPHLGASLAAGLPARRLEPSLVGVLAFARSPIPARVRARAASATVRQQLSEDALARWRDRHGLPPLPPGTSSTIAGRLARLAGAAAALIRSPRP